MKMVAACGLGVLTVACAETPEVVLSAPGYSANFLVSVSASHYHDADWDVSEDRIHVNGSGVVEPSGSGSVPGETVTLSLTLRIATHLDLSEGASFDLCGEPLGHGASLAALVHATARHAGCDGPVVGTLRVLDCQGRFLSAPIVDLGVELHGPLTVEAPPGDTVKLRAVLVGVDLDDSSGLFGGNF